jgi:hypothetical protein
MGNIGIEIKTIRENQKKMLKMKNIVNRNEKCHEKWSRLDIGKKRVSELNCIPLKPFKLKFKKKKRNKISQIHGSFIKKCIIPMMGTLEREKSGKK